MNLRQLGNEIKKQGDDFKSKVIKYYSTVKDYNEKIRKDMMGSQFAKEELEKMKGNFDKELAESRENLLAKLEKVIAEEQGYLERNKEVVTPDVLSELTVLESLELDNNDIETYKNKYANNPLALRKLQSIAKAQGNLFFPVQTKEDVLRRVSSYLKTTIDYYQSINTQVISDMGGEKAIDWIVEGNKNGVDTIISEYENA